MNGKTPRPSLEALKDQAKRLRLSLLAQQGKEVSHSKSLELIAAQFGFRDWNTLHATVGSRPPINPYMLGSKVRGYYLGQPFEAEILGVQALGPAGERFRLTLNFDEPVDVVTFDSFSAFRKRVNCTVDGTGRTKERTSNGRPHLELSW